MWSRPELEGMFVAQHWSTSCNFALACQSESAAQSLCKLQGQVLSHCPSQPRTQLWSLLRGDLPWCADVLSACRSFRGKKDAIGMSPHPYVVPVLGELSVLRPRHPDVATASVQAAEAGPSTAAADPADSAAAHEQGARQPWLRAAGYLGRSVTAMLSSNAEGSAADGDCGNVKCNQDEVADLLQKNLIVLASREQGVQLGGRQWSASAIARAQRRGFDASSDDSTSQEEPQGSASGSNAGADGYSTEEGNRKRQRDSEDTPGAFMQRNTELMGMMLQDVAEMSQQKQRKLCKNAPAVEKVLSDVRSSLQPWHAAIAGTHGSERILLQYGTPVTSGSEWNRSCRLFQ